MPQRAQCVRDPMPSQDGLESSRYNICRAFNTSGQIKISLIRSYFRFCIHRSKISCL